MRNGLWLVSIGMIGIMTSAVGDGMKINYLTLTTSLFITAIGYMIYRRGKQKNADKGQGE